MIRSKPSAFPKRIRNLQELADYLSENYGRFIPESDDCPDKTMRLAGQVELAERIIATISQEYDPAEAEDKE